MTECDVPFVPQLGSGIDIALYKMKTIAAVTNGIAKVNGNYIPSSTTSPFLSFVLVS